MGGDESSSARAAAGSHATGDSAGPVQPADELDDLVEAAFGSATTGGPGPFDAGLGVAGAALLAWWLAGGGTGPGLAAGVALLTLGAALPVRTVLVAANHRRRSHRDGG